MFYKCAITLLLDEINLVQLELEAEHLGEEGGEGAQHHHLGDVVEVGVGAEAGNLVRRLQLLDEVGGQLQHVIRQHQVLLLLRLPLQLQVEVDLLGDEHREVAAVLLVDAAAEDHQPHDVDADGQRPEDHLPADEATGEGRLVGAVVLQQLQTDAGQQADGEDEGGGADGVHRAEGAVSAGKREKKVCNLKFKSMKFKRALTFSDMTVRRATPSGS